MKWEYKTVKLKAKGFMGGKVDEVQLDAMMNDLGRDEWELAAAFDTNEAYGNTRDVILLFQTPDAGMKGEPDENGEIDPDDEEFGPAWTVYANVRMIPEYSEIMRIQAELDQLARPFGGNSDGWGVMLDGGDEVE